MPRMYVAATKPARSPTTPPPSAMITSSRVSCFFGRALEKLGVGCWVLSLLAGLKGRNAHGQPGLFQPLLDGRQEQRADVRVGDDEVRAGPEGRPTA